MVDVCLIPEVKFELEALTDFVKDVMRRKGHCVVCIAEGAGQDIVQHGHTGTDKSGNPILKDIGTHVRDIFKDLIEASACSVVTTLSMCRMGHVHPFCGGLWEGERGGGGAC